MGVNNAPIRRFWTSSLLGVVLALFLAPAASAANPTASFTVSPESANLNTPVRFDAATSGGQITQYLWDFGDGAMGSGITVTHSYAAVGTFHVTLTVVDSSGDIGQSEHNVAIGGAPPTAAFIPDSGTVLAGSPVHFDGTPSSDPDATVTSWRWNFGDGSTASGAHPTHAYTMPKTYTVSLSVTDSAGKSSTITHQLNVIAPPPIQTLIRTIIPAPAAVSSGRPSVSRSGLADLGLRLFCPGPGPACQTTVTPGSRASAYTTTVSVAPNRSFELLVLLTPKGMRALRSHGRLPLAVTVASVRGAESIRARVAMLLKRPANRRR